MPPTEDGEESRNWGMSLGYDEVTSPKPSHGMENERVRETPLLV